MQFRCSVAKLIEGLQITTRALSARTTNPILEGVLVETNDEGIRLTCSDERITILTQVEAEVSEHGRGVVPGKLFFDIVRRLPEEEVTVVMNEQKVFRIRSGQSRTNIAGQDGDLFPRLPKLEQAEEISLPQDMLRDMIQKTEFAIAPEDMREVLTGALLEIVNGDCNMVALDGFRMAIRSEKCSALDVNVSAIVPGRAIGDIGKLLSGGEDDFARLSFSQGKLKIELGDTEIYVILIGGSYVSYRQILPTAFATRAVVALEPFRQCIDRAALIAREGNNNLLLLKFHEGEMDIEAHSPVGDVHEELPCDLTGPGLTIAFNVRYLIDVVRSIESDNIVIQLNSAVQPCVIEPEGDHGYLHLVLPVRTSQTN